MDPAIAMALVAASLNLASGLFFISISRAPNWRIGRLIAIIALTAGVYSLLSLILCLPGLADPHYVAAGRGAYLVASLHCCAWLVYAFGDAYGTLHAVPSHVRWTLGFVLALAVFFAATGLHLHSTVEVVAVAWAGVQYHYPLTTRAGDIYGLLFPAILAAVFVRLLRRCRRGEVHLRWHLAGFSLFFLCTLDEVLVANRVIEFLSLADVGFLFVVLPLSIEVLHRVAVDSRRLHHLSTQLEQEVRSRTEERDHARAALVESERLAALGRLAAGVGHEINNPLTYLQLSLDELQPYLAQTNAPAPIQQTLEDARDGARRVQKVVEGLRSYSRGPGEPSLLHPHELARTSLKVAAPQLRHLGTVDLELGPCPAIQGHEAQLVQGLINLLVNAAQAASSNSGQSRILLSTRTDSQGRAVFAVEDNGPGISPEHLRRLSEPYFTTRTAQGGLGLGLFITRGILEAHGGQLEFESAAGRGTTARMLLPAAPASATARQMEPGSVTPRTASSPQVPTAQTPILTPKRRILLIDDETALLKVLSRFLSRSWNVTTATSAPEALHHLEHTTYDAILCDLMMPGMSGMEFAETLASRSPNLRTRTFFLTGGAVTPAAQEFLSRPDVRHFEKPLDLPRLCAAIDQVATPTPTS